MGLLNALDSLAMFQHWVFLALTHVPSYGMSTLILLTLSAIFAGSWVVFWILVVRSTAARYSVSLKDWGRMRGMRFLREPEKSLPPPLDAVSLQRLVVRFCLFGQSATLVQFKSIPPAGTSPADAPMPRGGLWNLFICEIGLEWPATGLRPVAAVASALDLFSMASFPLLGSSDRFVIFGTEPKAAAALSRSSSRGLLPPDVGLLLHGKHLVLDFSARPFDTIEFERMIAVAEQIVIHLPAPQVAE